VTIEQTVGTTVGILSGVASAALEASAGQSGISVPIISALVGGAVSYGILRGTVIALEARHKDLREELHSIRDTLHMTAEKVARIEGTMERRGQPRV
jgi:hypothetical protein